MDNNNINKECWTKYTSFKILGIKLFEREEILDSSQFKINKDFAFYSERGGRCMERREACEV